MTEYPAAPASAALAFLALSYAWPRGGAARWRVIAGVGVGAGICLIVLLTYLHAAFGSFRPSYSYYEPDSFSFMQRQGYMGLTYPHPDRLLKLLFGCSRGSSSRRQCCSQLRSGCGGCGRSEGDARPRWPRRESWSTTSCSTRRFTGGSQGCPSARAMRAQAFRCCASAWRWRGNVPGAAGASFWRCLAAGSVCLTLMVVSTTSQLSMQDTCPLLHSTWPAFWAGQVALNHQSMLTVAEAGSSSLYGAFNLGQLAGLRGLASLIPLLAVWACAAAVWVRSLSAPARS